jgi:hypothetical protein
MVPGLSRQGDVVAHRDIGPLNVLIDDGPISALQDAPGPRSGGRPRGAVLVARCGLGTDVEGERSVRTRTVVRVADYRSSNGWMGPKNGSSASVNTPLRSRCARKTFEQRSHECGGDRPCRWVRRYQNGRQAREPLVRHGHRAFQPQFLACVADQHTGTSRSGAVDSQTVVADGPHVPKVGCGRRHEFDPLCDRQEVRLRRVGKHENDDLVEVGRGPIDDRHVAQVERIERAGIGGDHPTMVPVRRLEPSGPVLGFNFLGRCPAKGARGGTRTHDLTLTRRLLCQLSYSGGGRTPYNCGRRPLNAFLPTGRAREVLASRRAAGQPVPMAQTDRGRHGARGGVRAPTVATMTRSRRQVHGS